MWNFGKPHVEFFLKSEMDDVSINKEALLLIETSLLRLENLGLCRWKPHVEFWETTCGILGNHMWNFGKPHVEFFLKVKWMMFLLIKRPCY
jgi:hypothetical protein